MLIHNDGSVLLLTCILLFCPAVCFQIHHQECGMKHFHEGFSALNSISDKSDGNNEASTASTSSSYTSGRIRRPMRRSSSSAVVEAQKSRQEKATKRHAEALKDPSLLSTIPFSERDDMHPATRRAIQEVLGLQTMTMIQAKTYVPAIQGESILGRSRTGTGKTLAFLLPSIQRLVDADLDMYRPGRTIGMLIVAPTRELAIQIAQQAELVLFYHRSMSVACIYGGTKMQRDMRLFTAKDGLPTILVATPGRLVDHLKSTKLRGRKMSDIISETKIAVFDETDVLFGGFNNEMKDILMYLPRSEKRQTMMFSATLPTKLRLRLKELFKADLVEVDCVPATSKKEETNIRVKQSYLLLDSMENYLSTLIGTMLFCKEVVDNPKMIVFFPTNKLVRLFYNLFADGGLGLPVFELHSNMSQASRNRASSQFGEVKAGILFSSDVSARGVDYPDISHVIQYGAPRTKNGYVHRLGRTGRAGQEGRGLIIFMPFESEQISAIRKRGGQLDRGLTQFLSKYDDNAAADDGELRAQFETTLQHAKHVMQQGKSDISSSTKAAFLSFLAYYIASDTKTSPSQLLSYAESMFRGAGVEGKMPEIESDLASRLGLTK